MIWEIYVLLANQILFLFKQHHCCKLRVSGTYVHMSCIIRTQDNRINCDSTSWMSFCDQPIRFRKNNSVFRIICYRKNLKYVMQCAVAIYGSHLYSGRIWLELGLAFGSPSDFNITLLVCPIDWRDNTLNRTSTNLYSLFIQDHLATSFDAIWNFRFKERGCRKSESNAGYSSDYYS